MCSLQASPNTFCPRARNSWQAHARKQHPTHLSCLPRLKQAAWIFSCNHTPVLAPGKWFHGMQWSNSKNNRFFAKCKESSLSHAASRNNASWSWFTVTSRVPELKNISIERPSHHPGHMWLTWQMVQPFPATCAQQEKSTTQQAKASHPLWMQNRHYL